MRTARGHQARNFLGAQTAEALNALPARKTFEVRLLCRAEHLDAFLGEITVKTRERQSGPIDCRLPDLAMKADALAFELQLEFLAMRVVKTFHGDDRNVLPQIAPRGDRLRCRFIGHRPSPLSRDLANFHRGS